MSRKKSILIIEDEIHYGEMLRDATEFFGYSTYLAYSATGGLDLIRQKQLDLIICDINLPGSNGIDVVKKMMGMYLNIPIVLMTGAGNLKLIRQGLELGVSDYLIKPLKVEELPIVLEKNLERKRLNFQNLQSEKADILFEALKALMRALDAKDHYTCGHSQRVAGLAMMMGEKLGLGDNEQYVLQLAAYFHDIGKIGMPDNILKKAEGLEDYEYNIAKDHPVVGSRILSEINELAEVASIVRHHHERYDGQGYPDGLKGEAIPYFSRILAIIDCYEALVSDRVYRQGVDKDEALAEIKSHAHTQFDPRLVKVFVEVIEQESRQAEIEPQLLTRIKPQPQAGAAAM